MLKRAMAIVLMELGIFCLTTVASDRSMFYIFTEILADAIRFRDKAPCQVHILPDPFHEGQ